MFKNCITFVPTKPMGYGVMVTLQILVLSFLVRARVPQQKIRMSQRHPYFFCYMVV